MSSVIVDTDRWYVRWQTVPAPRVRLFCLPHSGGGGAVYRPWIPLLPADVELNSVRLPGRESRYRETAFSRLDELVPALVDNVTPLLDRPHAWFGHSMGALLAFEVVRELRRRGLPGPLCLLISGRPAPHLVPREQPISQLPDQEFAELVARLNGTPGEVYTKTSAFATFIPTLRADFSVIETYSYQPEPPLELPIAVFGGEQDPVASIEELQAWQPHSTAGCTVRTYPGDHFYLNPERESLLAAVTGELATQP